MSFPLPLSMNDADAAKRSVSYFTEGKFFLRLNPIIGECGAIRYGAEARLADRPTPRRIPSATSVNMRRGFGLRLNGFRGSRRAFRLSRLRPPRPTVAPKSSSKLTLRWRELDSKFQFRAEMGFRFRLLGNSAKKPSPVFFTIRPVLADLGITISPKMSPGCTMLKTISFPSIETEVILTVPLDTAMRLCPGEPLA